MAALLVLIGVAAALLPTDAAADPAWQRTPLTPIPERSCQELVIERRGEGPLEVRFPLVPLPAMGKDLRMAGASLWVPPEPSEAIVVSVPHPASLPARAFEAEGPIRWIRDAGRLCLAAGLEPMACATTRAPVVGSQRIAFGPGWQTSLRGCAEFEVAPTSQPALWTMGAACLLGAVWIAASGGRRRRLWLLLLTPSIAYAALASIPGVWFEPRIVLVGALWAATLGFVGWLRGRRDLAPFALLALATAGWISLLPTPLASALSDRPEAPTEVDIPDAAALWADPAYWNPFAMHHLLGFRERAAASLSEQAEETWLVVGGSVTYGVEVTADQTFTAVAERALRAAGRPIRLLNAGVPAWTLGQSARVLSDLALHLDLQGVVVVSILNNPAFGLPDARPRGCDARLVRSALCSLRRNPGALTLLKYFLPKPGNAEHFGTTLRDLVMSQSARGRAVVLLDETTRWQLGASHRNARDESYRVVARREASRAGLQLHEVSSAVAAVPEGERFVDAIHLSAQGHAAVGHRLAEILASEAPR